MKKPKPEATLVLQHQRPDGQITRTIAKWTLPASDLHLAQWLEDYKTKLATDRRDVGEYIGCSPMPMEAHVQRGHRVLARWSAKVLQMKGIA